MPLAQMGVTRPVHRLLSGPLGAEVGWGASRWVVVVGPAGEAAAGRAVLVVGAVVRAGLLRVMRGLGLLAVVRLSEIHKVCHSSLKSSDYVLTDITVFQLHDLPASRLHFFSSGRLVGHTYPFPPLECRYHHPILKRNNNEAV